MGHPSSEVLSTLLRSLDCSSSVKWNNEQCEICLRAKQSRNQFTLSDNNAKYLFEVIHCDIWGPYRTPSLCGAHYFLTIVDDYSRGVWVYLMAEKSETEKFLKGFFALIRTQFEKKCENLTY